MRLLLSFALLLSIACGGCVSPVIDSPDPGTDSPAPGTDSPATGTPTVVTTDQAANSPHADHAVLVENRWNESVDLTLRVVREATDEVVHERTWEESPAGEREVYNLERTDPDGVEAYRVTLEVGADRNETVTLETSGCYGDAHFWITESGDLEATYSIC